MTMQELARDPQLLADFPDFILVKRSQRLNDPACFNELLNSRDAIVMGLNDVGLRGTARFDGVGINGALPQNPIAIQKSSRTQNAFLNHDELLADDMAL